MIRIALVISELEVGGTQRQMLELAKGLDRSRFAPELWCLSNVLTFAPAFERAGIPIVAVTKSSRFDVSILLRLRNRLRARLIDVVMSFGITADLWARAAAKMAGIKLVISSVRTSREGSWFLDQMNRLIAPTADHFISNSQAAAEHLRAHLRISPERITVIRNGTDLAAFAVLPSRGEARAALGLPRDALLSGASAGFRRKRTSVCC